MVPWPSSGRTEPPCPSVFNLPRVLGRLMDSRGSRWWVAAAAWTGRQHCFLHFGTERWMTGTWTCHLLALFRIHSEKLKTVWHFFSAILNFKLQVLCSCLSTVLWSDFTAFLEMETVCFPVTVIKRNQRTSQGGDAVDCCYNYYDSESLVFTKRQQVCWT